MIIGWCRFLPIPTKKKNFNVLGRSKKSEAVVNGIELQDSSVVDVAIWRDLWKPMDGDQDSNVNFPKNVPLKWVDFTQFWMHFRDGKERRRSWRKKMKGHNNTTVQRERKAEQTIPNATIMTDIVDGGDATENHFMERPKKLSVKQ